MTILPIEWFVAFAGGVCLWLYRSLGVALREPLALYLSKLNGALLWYFVGLLLAFLVSRLSLLSEARRAGTPAISRAAAWREFSLSYLNLGSLIRDLRVVHCVALTFFLFIQLKHLTPLLRARQYDEELAVFDRLLCGGEICAAQVISYLGNGWAHYLSIGYTLFYPYLGIVLVLFVMQRDFRLTSEFVGSFAAVWFLGIAGIYLVPSYGPVFVAPELFTALPATEVTRLQADLWKHREFLQGAPLSPRGVFLISGIPSLHVAMVVLGSVYLRELHRGLAAVSWAFLAVTVVSTIYFGWHYLLDDLAALPLVWAAVSLSKAFCRVSGDER